jgi:prevent-host-death family protein
MKVTNIHEAKTHLSKLIERVEEGEEIVIGRAGRPIAKLVPFQPPAPKRKPGSMRGKIVMGRGFDEADVEIAAMFLGESH